MEENKQNINKSTNLLTNVEASILRDVLLENKNILVLGETGKTAMLNSIINLIDKKDNLLIFDDYNEISVLPREGKVFKVGYHHSSDIRGDRTKHDTHIEMTARGLLLPFDRVIADELYPIEIEKILKTIYGTRSGIFSINFSQPEDALKHIYLKTMYPAKKVLPSSILEVIKKQFHYYIKVGKPLIIEKIVVEGDKLVFKKIN